MTVPGTPVRDGRFKIRSSAGRIFRILAVSMYEEDVLALDELVAAARAAGHPRANRSAMLRYAYKLVRVSDIPKGL